GTHARGKRQELLRVCSKKFFGGGWGVGVGGWGMGCGVWGFTHFQVVNYLIFREKVPEFSPQSLQGAALFEGKKV
ncbi:hypothetical protein, partial [Microcystis sp. M112S1]|uniref:hypothetical protein n=1 Tax=Microcystis sp. M112S1 TaxID=2771103 RepID=UPI00258AB3F6